MNDVPVTAVSGFVPVEPLSDYWGENDYFSDTSTGVRTDNDNSLDAVFTPLATMKAQPSAQPTASTGRRLDLARIRLTDLLPMQAEVSSYVDEESSVLASTGYGDIRNSSLAVVLNEVVKGDAALLLPVIAVEAQVLVLCWLVLFLLVANAAEARGPEVALAKLRGLPAGRTVAFGLLDTLALVVAAVPAGFALAWLLVHALTRTQLAPGTPVVATGAAVLATAGAGAALAAVLAATGTLRRPVVEQWRRATRRVKARAWAVDLVLAAAALVGMLALVQAGAVSGPGSTQGATASPLALLVPGLLVPTEDGRRVQFDSRCC